MAQPQTIEITVHVDVTEARRRVRRLMADLKDLNRELARVEEGLAEHYVQLDAHLAHVRKFGIAIKNGDDDD